MDEKEYRASLEGPPARGREKVSTEKENEHFLLRRGEGPLERREMGE